MEWYPAEICWSSAVLEEKFASWVERGAGGHGSVDSLHPWDSFGKHEGVESEEMLSYLSSPKATNSSAVFRQVTERIWKKKKFT